MLSFVTPIESVTFLRHKLISVMIPITMQVVNDSATIYGMCKKRAVMMRTEVVADRMSIVLDQKRLSMWLSI